MKNEIVKLNNFRYTVRYKNSGNEEAERGENPLLSRSRKENESLN